MQNDFKKLLRAQRNMAFERAKGELYSVLHTYYDSGYIHNELNRLIENFIAEVDDNGYLDFL